MSDCIWVSGSGRCMDSDENFWPFFDSPNDPVADDRARRLKSADICNRLDGGEILSPEELPKKFFHSAKHDFKSKVPVAFGTPFILLKDQAIQLLTEFDLGDAYFSPVALYQWDRTTPVDLKVSTMCIGNPIKTVRQDQTPLIEVVPGKSGLKTAPHLLGDDHIVTRADALDGPDLWVDPEFKDMWCLSDRLARALIKAGLKNTLDLVRTKTV